MDSTPTEKHWNAPDNASNPWPAQIRVLDKKIKNLSGKKCVVSVLDKNQISENVACLLTFSFPIFLIFLIFSIFWIFEYTTPTLPPSHWEKPPGFQKNNVFLLKNYHFCLSWIKKSTFLGHAGFRAGRFVSSRREWAKKNWKKSCVDNFCNFEILSVCRVQNNRTFHPGRRLSAGQPLPFTIHYLSTSSQNSLSHLPPPPPPLP